MDDPIGILTKHFKDYTADASASEANQKLFVSIDKRLKIVEQTFLKPEKSKFVEALHGDKTQAPLLNTLNDISKRLEDDQKDNKDDKVEGIGGESGSKGKVSFWQGIKQSFSQDFDRRAKEYEKNSVFNKIKSASAVSDKPQKEEDTKAVTANVVNTPSNTAQQELFDKEDSNKEIVKQLTSIDSTAKSILKVIERSGGVKIPASTGESTPPPDGGGSGGGGLLGALGAYVAGRAAKKAAEKAAKEAAKKTLEVGIEGAAKAGVK